MSEESTELAYGQTPWDGLDHDELLRVVQRMYSAIVSLNSVLRISAINHPDSIFFGPTGSGGTALEKARQILEPLHAEFDSNNIYRAFFRYADDLLFETEGFRIGFGWAVCPKCSRMWGDSMDGRSHVGATCSEVCPLPPLCDGVLRPLAWEDLRPG